MARAQFHKGQRVWVETVGVWVQIEQIKPVWAKGFDEPVRITYDVGLGREFLANELQLPVEDTAVGALGDWRILRARNKWQDIADCAHHPQPGSYPVVVTDQLDWGGWRVPGAEYDRDPSRMEFQARLIATAPQLFELAKELIDTTAEDAENLPAETLRLALLARKLVGQITEITASPVDLATESQTVDIKEA